MKLRQRLPPNEYGFSLCRTPAGKLVNGPVASGTPNSVNIPVSCPAGSRFIGLDHSHPGGVAVPSSIDIASAKKVGARVLCIQSDTETRCHKMGNRRR